MKSVCRLLLLLVLSVRSAFAITYWFDSAPFTTYGEFNPPYVFTGSDSGHTVKQMVSSSSIRFASRSAYVGIVCYISTAAARTYVLLQDGVEIASFSPPTTGGGAFNTYSIATGLDTTAVHEYEILCITPITGAVGNWYDAGLDLDANGIEAVAHAARPIAAFYGDSITGVTSASPPITDTRYSDMWIATQRTGYAMAISATGGGKVVNTGRDSTSGISALCSELHVRYGTNDLADLGSTTPNTTFQTAYGVMIDNARTQIGAGKPIYCYQPFPRATGDTNRALAGTLIQAAISGKSDVYYIPTDNWVGTTGATMHDGLHPNVAGYAELANRLTPVLAASAFAVTGPTTGPNLQASSDFTVTLFGGATFTGDQTVTVAASAGTLTATAGGVSGNGTGTVTATPASGATSFTFNYTPDSGGSKTLNFTAAQAQWSTPTALSYLSSALSAGRPGSYSGY